VFEFAYQALTESQEAVAAPPPPAEGAPAEGDGAAPPPPPKDTGPNMEEIFGGDERLSVEQLAAIIEAFDGIVEKISESHPEPLEQRALLFWEFFEVLMEACRGLVDTQGLPLDQAVPAFVKTQMAFMGLVDLGKASLPAPPATDFEEDDDDDIQPPAE